MLIRMAVADTDTEYLDRLLDVLNDYSDLRLSVYSDVNILREAITAGRFDVLLVAPSMLDNRFPIEKLTVTIMLAGDNKIPYGYDSLPIINKYQRISGIYQHVLEICSDKLDIGATVSGTAAVLVFYSPVGGSGKTTSALIAATRLAMRGLRTFYLNLESFPSDGCYLDQNSQNGLSALLDRICQKEEQAVMFMQSCLMTKCDNFYYLKHFDNPNDYSVMSVEDLDKLVTLLRKFGSFDYIIIDTENSFDAKIKYVFDVADKIVIIEKPDVICRLKLESFFAQTFITDDFGRKMRRLINFYNGRDNGLVTDIPSIGFIGIANGADSGSLIAAKAATSEADFAVRLVE